MNNMIKLAMLALCGLSASAANAAIALDRTRVVFPGGTSVISLKVDNNNKDKPYLAQAWLEDANGNKINSPFTALPPIQRVEPNTSSMVQIRALPAVNLLPQDKESLFYFNLREVPPKSEKPNVLQLALQTKIKFFYRPQALIVPADSNKAPWQEQVRLQQDGDGYKLENPTPYYITVVEAAKGSNEKSIDRFEALMLAPKSSSKINLNGNVLGSTPSFIYVDDYGGRRQLNYRCGTGCQLQPAN